MKKVVLGFFELCVHILAYALVIFLVYKAALFAYDFSYQVFGNPVMSKYDAKPVTIEVKSGETAADIARDLKDSGLIKYELAFNIRVRLEKMGDKIMPGTFELSPDMPIEEILLKLTTEGEIIQADEGGISR